MISLVGSNAKDGEGWPIVRAVSEMEILDCGLTLPESVAVWYYYTGRVHHS